MLATSRMVLPSCRTQALPSRPHTLAGSARVPGSHINEFTRGLLRKPIKETCRSLPVDPADAAAIIRATTSMNDLAPLLQVGLPVAAIIGLLAYRFTLYGQLEYITASMLTRYVPKTGNGPVVIQCGGGTRELYYYPKNTIQITVVGEDVNFSLFEQAGAQAAVPTTGKKQSPLSLSFAAEGSVDAVVALKTLGMVGSFNTTEFLDEALRVLKPGCPLIFVEKLYEGGSPLRPLVGNTSSGSISLSLLEGMKERSHQWEFVQWDVALEGQDPHAVGVAVRAANYRFRNPVAPAKVKAAKEEVKAPKTKGFGSDQK